MALRGRRTRTGVSPARRARQERSLSGASLFILVLGLAQVATPALSRVVGTTTAQPVARAIPTASIAGGPRWRPEATASSTAPPSPDPTPAPPVVTPAAPLTQPPIRVTSPGGYGCQAALAYLAANQAPGFVDICAPHAAGPGAAGRTVADLRPGVTTGTIYISCPAPIVYQNEASNSWKFSGLSNAPLDPWGGVPWSQCRSGDISPA